MRVDLNVPFSEKDEAKALGAKWDPIKKVWYVVPESDLQSFCRWFPQISDEKFSIRAGRYYVGKTKRPCWNCGKMSNIFSVILDDTCETLEWFDCPEKDEEIPLWLRPGGPVSIGYLEALPSDVEKWFAILTKHYFLDYSKADDSRCWMNHCELCGAKQGDFHIHSHAGSGTFSPMDEIQAAEIQLHLVEEAIKLASCSYAGPLYYFDSMPVVPFPPPI